MENEERSGQPKKFEGEELEALLEEDCCQTQEELAESLGVTQAAILKRLKAAGYIQKQGNWVSHVFKPRDVERRFCVFFVEISYVLVNITIWPARNAFSEAFNNFVLELY